MLFMRWKHRYWFIVLLLLAGGLLVYGWFFPKKQYVETYLKDYLQGMGIQVESLEVDSVTMDALTIKNIQLAEGVVSIHSIVVRYSPSRLVRQQVDSITVEGVDIRAGVGEQGFSLGTLDHILFSSDSAKEPLLLPFRQLDIAQLLFYLRDQKSGEFLLAPMEMSVSIQVNSRQVDAKIHADNLDHNAPLQADAAYDLISGVGHIKVTVPEITFASGLVQPEHLFPSLRGELSAVMGTVSLAGVIDITPEKISPDLLLRLRDISFQTGDTVIAGLDGDVEFNNFSPFSTPDKQTLLVKAVDSVMPLRDGKIVFRMEGEALNITYMEWAWGEGRLVARNSVVDLTGKGKNSFVLDVENVALNDVVALNKEEFSASGALRGRIPVVIQGEDIRIENGMLETIEPGIIQYKPKSAALQAAMQEPVVGIAFSVLNNFHYKHLMLTLDSKANNDLDARLAMTGSNPDVENGRFVKLNINLKGNILDLLKSSMDIYQLPQNIIEQVTNGKTTVE